MVRKPPETFQENLEEVKNLLAIHRFLTGEKPGRRHSAVAVLNKSGIVLLVACWESFVEDLADKTFSALLTSAKTPYYFPKSVQKLVVSLLKDDKNELKILELAGDGWKSTLKQYRTETVTKFIGGFNTPSAENIDGLFSGLIGLDNLSKCWSWPKTRPGSARRRLSKLIKLRGDIAHRVKSKSGKTIQKGAVESYSEFIQQLAEHSNQRVNRYLKAFKRRK
jgi:hypothetical protein